MILSRETIAGRPARPGNSKDAVAREDDLAVVGVHAMLFDDDAAAGFINSPEALVPWNGDDKLLIDRFDVRHLLEDLTGLRRRRAWTPTDASEEELDHERYKDLQDDSKDVESTSEETPSAEKLSGDYNTVSFDYGTDQKTSPSRSKEIEEPFVPQFPVPDYLQPHMPSSQKIHQIISGTAKFVSEHGGQAEIVLKVKQANNPTFGFLMPDHPLHLYFRYLVDHPLLTGANSKSSRPGNASLSMPAEGLRLLGEVYGDDNEEEEDSTSHDSGRLAAQTDGSYTRKPPAPSVHFKDLGKPVKEPPPHVKVVIGKMVEFISRNGKDFEDVVRDRDKADQRFHFLRPWNEYHSYYLKMLQTAKQIKPAVTSGSESGAISRRRKPFPKPSAQGYPKESTGNAVNLNEGKQQYSQTARGRSRFDVTPNMLQSIAPTQISKVDCTESPVLDAQLSGNNKEKAITKNAEKEQCGMSYDAAFAAVMAATRGMRKSREQSPLALTTIDRGVQLPPANSEARKEDSGSEGGGQVSVEVPSTDLELTAEEKKAERLRKAKRLAELIRSNDAVEIAESSEAIADRLTSGQETAAACDGDNSLGMEDIRTEKEISNGSGRKHHHHRHHRHRTSHDKEGSEYKTEKRKRHKCREANSEADSLDGSEGHISGDKNKHCHRSTDDEKRRHSDEKEDYEHRTHRRRNGKHRDDTDSLDDSEDNVKRDKRSKHEVSSDQKHRSTYDGREERRRHRKHHSSRHDKHGEKTRIHKQEPEKGSPGTEISDDIRAKVRAMLLQI